VFGRDDQLVHTRSLILEKAGFRVRIAYSIRDLQQLLSDRSMDVMVLCHSLAPKECDQALLLVHQAWPHIQTLALVTGYSDCGSTSTDAKMEVSEGPARLIDAVCERLNQCV
jgi:DNA-binding response OmpR family regulator